MSQAIFHEHCGTQDAISTVLSGSLTAPSSVDFVMIGGNRITLYTVTRGTDSNEHLRYAQLIIFVLIPIDTSWMWILIAKFTPHILFAAQMRLHVTR